MDRHEVTNAEFAAFVKAIDYVTTAERAIDAIAHADRQGEILQPGRCRLRHS